MELQPSGEPDWEKIEAAAADPGVKEVFIQRSRGYTARPALSVETIDKIIDLVHRVNPGAACVVDNCYGEFTEEREPKGDLLAGSLIKNPGGGLAPMGGYVAGRADLVEAAAFRLTVPGLGGEIGATLGFNRSLFQGLFLAPHTVAQALKTAVFAAALAVCAVLSAVLTVALALACAVRAACSLVLMAARADCSAVFTVREVLLMVLTCPAFAGCLMASRVLSRVRMVMRCRPMVLIRAPADEGWGASAGVVGALAGVGVAFG